MRKGPLAGCSFIQRERALASAVTPAGSTNPQRENETGPRPGQGAEAGMHRLGREAVAAKRDFV